MCKAGQLNEKLIRIAKETGKRRFLFLEKLLFHVKKAGIVWYTELFL